MSKREGQFSVVGSGGEGQPLSLNPRHTVGKAPSAAAIAAVVPQPQIATPAASSSSSSKPAPSAAKRTGSSKKKPVKPAKAAARNDDDDEDDDKEEIIPMKVPMSDSDDDDESAPASSSRAAAAVPALDKSFLTEAEMGQLQPQPFSSSSSKNSATAVHSSREQEEAELASLEAATKYRPRAEWSTEGSDRTQTEVFCCTWSPDSRFLAVGCGDGSIRVFNASTGRIAYLLRSSAAMALGASSAHGGESESLPITCIRFRPAGEDGTKPRGVLLATSADGSVTHWHMMSQTCLYSFHQEQDSNSISGTSGGDTDAQVYACDYRHDGEQFATGGRDGKVRVYDEATKELVVTLGGGGGGLGSGAVGSEKKGGGLGHSNRIYSLRFHPSDGNTIVSGGWDNTVQIWDVATGVSLRSFYGPHICGDGLDISPDGRTLLTGSWRPNEALQRWDLATGKLLDTVPFAAGPGGLGADRPELLYAAAWAPDGRSFAAGGCGTNETKLFALGAGEHDKPKVIERISAGSGGVYCLAFAPSGKKIAMGGGSSTVVVVDL